MTTIQTTDLHTIASDETLTQPIEIHLMDNGTALAVYDGASDVEYTDLDSLLSQHTIDVDHFVELLSARGDEDLAQVVALATTSTDDEPTTDIGYLALYTGPNGPISVAFIGQDLDDAAEHVAEFGSAWFDDTRDALSIDPDNHTLDKDIERALTRGQWTLARQAATNADYAIYTRQ